MGIFLKDAIEGLKEIKANTADVIIADPPYNIGQDFGNNKDKRSDYLEWSDNWINAAILTLKDSGTLYIYGFPEILAHISVRISINHKWLVWHYTNKTIPNNKFWQRSHESILHCWKNKNSLIFNLDSVREPYTECFLKNDIGRIRKNSAGRFNSAGLQEPYKAHENGALPRDVLKIPALSGGAGAAERWFYCKTCQLVLQNKEKNKHDKHKIIQHPAQKPYELTKKLLLAAKPNKDGLVIIPFAGSGSECAVASDLGMNYIGFEINEDYVFLSNRFLKNRKPLTS